jgi:UDP-glucose 4-epimerase
LIYAGSSSHHSGKFKNPYTFSKDIGEEIVQLYQQHYGLKASVARFYNVYGPHQLEDGGYQTILGKWLRLKRNGEQLVIYGDGSKKRDFTHVDDIVDGLVRIYWQNAWGHTFELGSGVNYSILEIAKFFDQPYTFDEDKSGEAQETLCDISFAKKTLGYDPQRCVECYIKEEIKKL